MKLIVGLGNVGKRYTHTRHNIGFMIIDQLLENFQASPDTSANAQIYGLKVTDWQKDTKCQAETAKVELEDEVLILAKPLTMMNLSGDAVQRLMQKYRLKPADVWVIHDDLDVNFGRLRIRRGSSSGQQGIRSIMEAIGSGFVQARMGISLNDRAIESSEAYVLRPFAPHEAEQLPRVIRSAAQVLARQIVSQTPAETTFDLLA
jgi:peptidyl-tRNA hydrolase, PTH1 family